MAIIEEEQSQEFYDKLFEELGVYLEEDGFHCSRCYKAIGWGGIPDSPHDCIECAECGEFESCICDAKEEFMKPGSIVLNRYYVELRYSNRQTWDIQTFRLTETNTDEK